MSADDPPTEESLRESVERSRSGAPAAGAVVRDRFSADEIFQRIIAAADEEITSGNRELFFSGLAAGFAITLTFLLYASMVEATESRVLGAILYPLGFIYIIIGGYQLYTENTLPPVALVLEGLVSVPLLLRNWVVVLAGNFTGGLVGAVVLAFTGVFSPETSAVAADIAQKGIETPGWDLFFKAAVAGLIVAGVVWVEYAARDTISRVLVVYLAFLTIPLGQLFHVVVSFTETMFLVFSGQVGLIAGMGGFVLPVLVGNTIGGVALVTVVNYFQTTENRLQTARFEGAKRQLTPRERVIGGIAGRAYVPVVDTAEVGPHLDTATYEVMVPISNPRTDSQIVEFACTVARERENGLVHIVHIVQTPEKMDFRYGAQNERIIESSEQHLERLREVTTAYDISCETSTVVSHKPYDQIVRSAARIGPDLVVIGWETDTPWVAGRPQSSLDELTSELPCDFVVLRARDLDGSKILVTTAGGPDSELSAEIAATLRNAIGSAVTILQVVDTPAEAQQAERVLEAWAAEHDLEDARITVDTSGDVETAIYEEAKDHTLVMIGATERGMLSRLVTDSLHMSVVNEVDASVLLAERPAGRSLSRRLFGLQ
jgi:formate/nitrite transporter FocA (FNT family)/nucleotide-binding universal stress UspA family protein